MFFISAFQFTSKEKVSEGKNFDQSKNVEERRADHDRASDGRKENNAGTISAVSLISYVMWFLCHVSIKKEDQIIDAYDKDTGTESFYGQHI